MKYIKSDSKKKDYVLPERILCSFGVQNECQMLQYNTDQSYFGGDLGCVIAPHGFILFDFGCELSGGIKIVCNDCSGNKNAEIRIRFGESAGEANAELGEMGCTNDHSVRDARLCIPWVGNLEYGNTGYRFVRIDNLSSYSVSLRQVFGVFIHCGKTMIGKFSCSDPLLNQIFDTAAYTLYLNMQDYLYDGIKRDRTVWIGDMHPEVSGVLRLFGDEEIIRKSLDFLKVNTLPEKWMNDIPSYSMWWIKIQRDYYFYTGNREYLWQQLNYIRKLSEKIFSVINPDGSNGVDFKFIDWPSSEDPKAQDAGIHALLVIALESIAEILTVFEQPTDKALKEKCFNMLDRLRRHKPDYNDNKQAAALLAYAGLCNPKKVSNELFSDQPARGISAFLGYYVLQMLAQAGDINVALNILREYWGGMLRLGATTFWEDFNVDWIKGAQPLDTILEKGMYDVHGENGAYCYKGYRCSLCHGWACGPAPFLSEYVLGVRVVQAGCRKLVIDPVLGDLEWAEGSFPTPYGEVHVRVCKDNGRTVLEKLTVPREISVETRCACLQKNDALKEN